MKLEIDNKGQMIIISENGLELTIIKSYYQKKQESSLWLFTHHTNE